MRLLHPLRTRRRDESESGAILILGALFAAISLVAAALAVDIGRQAQEKRLDQRLADLIALDAARGLRQEDPLQVYDAVQAAAVQSAQRNGFDYTAPGNSMTVQLAMLDPNCDAIPLPNVPPVGTLAGAVLVTIRSDVDYAFVPGGKELVARALSALHGTAGECDLTDGDPVSTTPPSETELATLLGGVRIGSTLTSAEMTVPPLASIDATLQANLFGIVLDKTFGRTIGGGSVSLTSVGWRGLVDSWVTFDDLRSELGLTAGTVDQVLDTQLDVEDVLNATASVLNSSGDPSQAAVATNVANLASSVDAAAGYTIKLRDLLQVVGNAGNGTDVADVFLNVKDIVLGSALIADSNHLVDFALTSADLPAIPGVNGVTVKVALIEPPQSSAVGVPVVTARTAQVRTLINLNLTVPIPLLGDVGLALPFVVSGGEGIADLDSVTCPGTVGVGLDATSIGVSAITNVIKAAMGTVTDAELAAGDEPVVRRVRLINAAGLVTVDQTSDLSVQSTPGGPVPMTFTPAWWDGPERVTGGPLDLPVLAAGDLAINVLATDVLGLPLVGTSTVATAVTNAVGAAVPMVPDKLLKPVYKALGLSFGDADVWGTEGECGLQEFYAPGSSSGTDPPVTSATVSPTYGDTPFLLA